VSTQAFKMVGLLIRTAARNIAVEYTPGESNNSLSLSSNS